jgi:hypothetical protein
MKKALAREMSSERKTPCLVMNLSQSKEVKSTKPVKKRTTEKRGGAKLE